jgi:hypothetical protein
MKGSTTMHLAWIEGLASTSQLCVVFFARSGTLAEAEAWVAFLRRPNVTVRVLELPLQTRIHKLALLAGRNVVDGVHAPSWLEEWGLASIHNEMWRLVDDHQIQAIVASNTISAHRIGRALLGRFKGRKFVYLHDDFVIRHPLESAVHRRLARDYPKLRSYRPYRIARWQNALTWIRPRRAMAIRASLLGLFDTVLINCPEEMASIGARLPPNVNTVLWPYVGQATKPPAPSAEVAPAFDLGCLAANGSFNLEGLLFFHSQIWPRLRRERPNLTCLVAGSVVEPFARFVAEDEGISLIEFVPAVADFFSQIRISIVPLLSGTGISVKAVESLFWGKPTVATKVGVRGLGVVSGRDVEIAETPEAFTQAVLRLLDDPGYAASLGAHGARTVAPSVDRDHFIAAVGRLMATPGASAL